MTTHQLLEVARELMLGKYNGPEILELFKDKIPSFKESLDLTSEEDFYVSVIDSVYLPDRLETRIAGVLWSVHDEPAVVTVKGDRFWYKNGELHRKNGNYDPAVITANGRNEWWVDGQKCIVREDL